MYEEKITSRAIRYLVGSVFFGLFALIAAWLYIIPQYNVWSERLAGEAELARADSNRKIRTLEAQAEQESSKALAEAEIIRAKGVAEANKIIGSSLQDNEGYLRYLWIQTLKTNQKEIVYVPTEASLPIMEAGRLKK